MLIEILHGVKPESIIIAALAYYVFGAFWFTPLFGKFYDKSLGFHRDESQRWGAIYYVMPLISSMLVSTGSAVLIKLSGINSLLDAITLGVLTGICYAMAISFNNAVIPNVPRPLLFGAVTGFYHLSGFTLVTVMIFSMR